MAAEPELRRPEPEVTVEAVEPEAKLLAGADPLGFADALGEVGSALAASPLRALAATQRAATDMWAAAWAAARPATGLPAEPVVTPEPRDRRFRDPAWRRDPLYFALGQAYLVWARWCMDLVDAADVEGSTKLKAEFAVRALVDALAPGVDAATGLALLEPFV